MNTNTLNQKIKSYRKILLIVDLIYVLLLIISFALIANISAYPFLFLILEIGPIIAVIHIVIQGKIHKSEEQLAKIDDQIKKCPTGQ